MVFYSARKVVRYPVLVINNTPIKRVTNFNYLGLQLSNDLNWDKHKCVISLKLTKTIGVLNRLRYEYATLADSYQKYIMNFRNNLFGIN